MKKSKRDDLKRWRRFNRNNKKFRYQDSDKWRWELTDSEKVLMRVIQEKFESN